jgi:hypothetical protein
MRNGIPSNALESALIDGNLKTITFVSQALGALFYILCLICAIGSLKLLSWARKGMLVYAFLAICNAMFGTMMFVFFILPRLSELRESGTPQMQIAALGAIVGYIIRLIISYSFPTLLFYYFTRPGNVDAFPQPRR